MAASSITPSTRHSPSHRESHPSAAPPWCRRAPLQPSGRRPFNASCVKLDILLWALVVAAIYLLAVANRRLTATCHALAATTQPAASRLQRFLDATLPRVHLLAGSCARCSTAAIRTAACTAAPWLTPCRCLDNLRSRPLATARLLPKTPVRSYLKLAPLDCGLALAADIMLTFRTSRPPAFHILSRIAVLTLLYVLCGSVCPAALLIKALQQRRYRCRPSHLLSYLPPYQDGCIQSTTARFTGPLRSQRTNAIKLQGAAAAVPMVPSRLQLSLAAAGTVPALASQHAGIAWRAVLHPGRTTTRLLSIKIHDHAAFSHRAAILASLKPTLLHGATSAPNPAPASPPVLLSSCAVEGCLQLLIAASTLDGTDPFNLSPGDDLSAFFCQLHSQLPASCRGRLVTIHLNGTVAAFKGSTGQQLPPELLHVPSSDSGEGLQWAPICFEAVSQKEVEVEVTCGMTGPGVEVVVQYGRGGEEVAVKLQVEEVAGSHASVRLKLPANLDTGPVAIYLVSTQEGRQGVLLGSATTMALPPPAAAELLQAYEDVDTNAADSPSLQQQQQQHDKAGSADEYQAGLRGLLREIAMLWQLHAEQLHDQGGLSSDLCPPSSSQAGDSVSAGCTTSPCNPAAQLSLEVLQYLADNELPECHTLLSARCRAAAATETGNLEAAAATGASSEVLAACTRHNPTACTAPYRAAPTACETGLVGAAAGTPAGQSAASPSTGPRAAAASVEADGMGVRPSAVHHILTSLAGMLRWPASRLQPLAAASRAPGYSTWRQQQGRRVATPGWVFIIAIAAMAGWKTNRRLLADLGFGLPYAWAMGTMLLHLVPLVGPYVVLVLGGEYFRARRASLLVAFALLRALVCAAGLLGWLSVPDKLRAMWSSTWGAMIIHAVFRPCLQQVPWRAQLLISSIEEACKYVAQAASAGTSIAVVIVAVVVSGAVEALYLAVYARVAKAATKEVPGCPSGQFPGAK